MISFILIHIISELSKDWPLCVLSLLLLLNRLTGSDGLFAFLLEIRVLVAECLSAWAVYLCVHASSDDNTNSNKHAFLSPLPCNIFNIFKSIPSRKPGRSGTVEMRLVKVKILSSISLFLTNFFNHQKVVKQHVRVPSKSGWLYWVAKIASQWVEKQAKMEESPIRKIPSFNEPANLPPFLQGSISEP